MSAMRPEKPSEAVAAGRGSFDGHIREFVRRDIVARKPPEPAPEPSAPIETLIQRVAGNSVTELDKLIADLTKVRDFLQAEGDRVQGEIAAYVQVSQTTMASVKVITESMAQWRAAGRGRS